MPPDSIFYIVGTDVIVNALDPDKRDTYNIRLIGNIAAYTFDFIDFQVIVFDSCSSNVLIPSTIVE